MLLHHTTMPAKALAGSLGPLCIYDNTLLRNCGPLQGQLGINKQENIGFQVRKISIFLVFLQALLNETTQLCIRTSLLNMCSYH